MEQLAEENFKIIFHELNRFATFWRFVLVNKGLESFHTLDKFTKSAALKPREIFLQMMTSGDRYASLQPGIRVLNDFYHISKYMSEKKIPGLSCYVGKEWRFKENLYFIITPPGSEQMVWKLSILIESGFYQIWHEIVIAKVVDKTAKEVFPLSKTTNAANPLRLDGKLRNVFFLLVVLVGISIIGCAFEVTRFKLRLHKQATILNKYKN